MSGDAFRACVAYLRDIWDGVAAARREGATSRRPDSLPIRVAVPFPSPASSGAGGQDFHTANIDMAWRLGPSPPPGPWKRRSVPAGRGGAG